MAKESAIAEINPKNATRTERILHSFILKFYPKIFYFCYLITKNQKKFMTDNNLTNVTLIVFSSKNNFIVFYIWLFFSKNSN